MTITGHMLRDPYDPARYPSRLWQINTPNGKQQLRGTETEIREYIRKNWVGYQINLKRYIA